MIYYKEVIDMSLVQCPYEEEYDFIYIADDYTNNVLKLSGYSDINDNDYRYLCGCGILAGFLSEYSLESASNAYIYAQYILGSAFPLGEPIIATNAGYSYLYATEVITGRFELGEPIIANDAKLSYLYAKNVLEGRFELGEPIIATDAKLSYLYAKNVLKGRFELGENAISSDNIYKLNYEKLTGIRL